MLLVMLFSFRRPGYCVRLAGASTFAVVAALSATVFVAGGARPAPGLAPVGQSSGGPTVPVVLEAVRRTPGFTQGLVHVGGRLFESVGLYGASAVRVVDPSTGEVLRSVPLADRLFGEGLALSGSELVQLTWRAGRAIVYRYPTLEVLGVRRYRGEGWGLCRHGAVLVMSDGSARLMFRDPETFARVGFVDVVDGAGRPVSGLNELECARDLVYANQWRTPWIVAVDPQSGLVVQVIDVSSLMPAPGGPAWGVANGIAYDSAADAFYVTGKGWPVLYRVRF